MTSLATPILKTPLISRQHHEALNRAVAHVAPVWPLDQWIAVNPWWGMKHLAIEQVEQHLMQRAGARLTMPGAFYREAWESGRIQRCDLRRAVEERGKTYHEATLLAHLAQDTAPAPDYHSAWERPGEHEVAVKVGYTVPCSVFDQVAETCASYFDRHQQRWEVAQTGTLFSWWKTLTRYDRRWPAELRMLLDRLPEEAEPASAVVIHSLDLTPDAVEALTHTLLLRVNGWASWCQGLAWHTPAVVDAAGIKALTAILLAWEWLGVEHLAQSAPARHHAWQAQWRSLATDPTSMEQPLESFLETKWCWQRAYEMSYQRRLARLLASSPAPVSDIETKVQAAFCIDVRSERLRRHVEHVAPEVETLGVAGFFGLPIAHETLGPQRTLPRAPGLLTPRYRSTEASSSAALHHYRYQQEATRQGFRHASYSALSTFTMVETTGLAWGWKLLKDTLGKKARPASVPTSQGLYLQEGDSPVPTGEKIALAEALMVNLGLRDTLAPLLLLVGHEAQSDNNPHHAGLACGACGGQGGGLNARLAAQLLNDPDVREGLANRGFELPATTWVVAATHCTMTDQVTLLDTAAIPASRWLELEHLERVLALAAQATRQERAVELGLETEGLETEGHEARLTRLAQRGADWAQPRPEWGLANNAALLLAPRALTRGKSLDGRVFLHEYHAEQDPEGATLEALMTAPMLVTSWINLQYYASVVTPTLYGAGNKLLHSVVGGHIGVIEGNCPQLRIGLPAQSLHDGEQWYHEPMRLTVVIEAPRETIEGVLARQPVVAQLVENRWLWLCRRTQEGMECFCQGEWRPVPC